MLDYNIVHNGYKKREITNVKTHYRTTFTRWQVKEEELIRYEEEHGIADRWVESSQEYKDALNLLTEREYRQAVDNLERLVVQRLLELTKLGMNGVGKPFNLPPHQPDHTSQCLLSGYKLRERIGKALKRRSEAIRTALQQYNVAAAKLTPPRPQLSWASVLKAVTVADFDLLRDTRSDIRSLPWTEPSRRESAGLYFGIKRAHEEIVWLNVEIKRLLTFMRDTHVNFYHAISTNMIVNCAIARQLSVEWEYQDRINESIVVRLVQASRLHGFSGSLSFGTRADSGCTSNADVPMPAWSSLLDDHGNENPSIVPDLELEDIPRELDVDTELVVQFMERINILDST